jgi:ankyrin repeat protein
MQDIEGQTPLHYAVNCDNAAMIEYFYQIDQENFMEGQIISNGSEISYKAETELYSEKNILYRAIIKGRWLSVQSIIQNA